MLFFIIKKLLKKESKMNKYNFGLQNNNYNIRLSKKKKKKMNIDPDFTSTQIHCIVSGI